jgi:hypothetical protein
MCDPVLVSEIVHLHAINTTEEFDDGVIQAKMRPDPWVFDIHGVQTRIQDVLCNNIAEHLVCFLILSGVGSSSLVHQTDSGQVERSVFCAGAARIFFLPGQTRQKSNMARSMLIQFTLGVAELATNKRAREEFMAGHEKRMKKWEADSKFLEEENQAFLELEENRVLDCAECGNNVTGGTCPYHPSATVACSTCHKELPARRTDGRAAYDQVMAHCSAEHNWCVVW